MTIDRILLAIAPSPEDSRELAGVYRTMTAAQTDALNRTVARLLPVHSSHLLQPLNNEYPLDDGTCQACPPRREVQA